MGVVIIIILWLALALLTAPAKAQMTDYCAASLDLKEDPGHLAEWRMRCTIKKLDEERAEAEDKATQMEVNLAVAEAHLKAARAALDAREAYWKDYVAGLPHRH